MSSKLLPVILVLAGAGLGYATPRSPQREQWEYLVGVLGTDGLGAVTNQNNPVQGVGHAEGIDFMGREGWEFAGFLGQYEYACYVLWRRQR